ncbi:hypothetical protein Enr13x_67050 [Stieleria neptunia]|uniref:Uncharacterized protein n=1 Tax=Stieleria neptunia TaxID=2527979 RepID=A0A518I166_9BACT|nr:hypothetical protein Enr13x_67050 [Stieleria neptunia]
MPCSKQQLQPTTRSLGRLLLKGLRFRRGGGCGGRLVGMRSMPESQAGSLRHFRKLEAYATLFGGQVADGEHAVDVSQGLQRRLFDVAI